MRRKWGRRFAGMILAMSFAVFGTHLAMGKPPGDGDTGARYTPGYFDNFYGVASAGPSALWIVGNTGRILFSRDDGKKWFLQTSNTEENIFSVSFVDARKGWCSGANGTILHTEDGGTTWHRQDTGTRHPIFKIQFINEKIGYAVGHFGLFLRTRDGGKTWENKSIGEDVTLRGMFFVNEKVGYIVGEFGAIYKVADSGSSVSRLNPPVSTTLFAVHFSNENSGYAAGMDGVLLSTSDGGRTWRKEESGIKDHLLGVSSNGQSAVAVGLRGAMTVKKPGGKWTPVNAKTSFWLSGILFDGSRRGYAVGAHSAILHLEEIIGNAGGNK